ncbi:MAG: hypothetical protein WBQ86_11240 [Candidatus Binatus sp.]
MPLPDDVAIKISNHQGARLELLYSLWGDWVESVGGPLNPDNLFESMLDAADCSNARRLISCMVSTGRHWRTCDPAWSSWLPAPTVI